MPLILLCVAVLPSSDSASSSLYLCVFLLCEVVKGSMNLVRVNDSDVLEASSRGYVSRVLRRLEELIMRFLFGFVIEVVRGLEELLLL